ncbi:hypothetical protein E2C01_077961 [Portunus trituberculatus]|uniref:Uncharacterized protein n=1 Tax=Portunus trituberculatus TaxID=210409 RepID=A0A5B7INN2_PORTR|nr:hypothetical protein [Portunus trituberculatus]
MNNEGIWALGEALNIKIMATVAESIDVCFGHGLDLSLPGCKAAYMQGNEIRKEVYLCPPPEFTDGQL